MFESGKYKFSTIPFKKGKLTVEVRFSKTDPLGIEWMLALYSLLTNELIIKKIQL